MMDNRDHCVAYKRCGCADKTSGKRLGGRCGRLAEPGHGSWYFAVQVTDVSGRRRRARQGGFPAEVAARQAASDLIVSCRDAPVSAQCTVGRWLGCPSWSSDARGSRQIERVRAAFE